MMDMAFELYREQQKQTKALERLANAAERISLPQRWELIEVGWSEAQVKAAEGWEPMGFYDTREKTYVRMRRPNQAPMEDKETVARAKKIQYGIV